MNYQHTWNSPLGPLRLFKQQESLVGLYFPDHSPAPKRIDGTKDARAFSNEVEQLQQFFAGERNEFNLPTCFRAGTNFQREVWSQLTQIPYGETTSYGKIAKACGRAKAVRAIGAAVGRNPISIIVPCHRVLGANGSLTGFAGGIKRKQFLLDLEMGTTLVLRQSNNT